MQLVSFVILSSLTLSFFGCSTSSPGAGSGANVVNGSVGSLSIAAQSAIANYGIILTTTVIPVDGGKSQTTNINGLTIDVFDKADTCSELHTASTNGMDFQIPMSPATSGIYKIVSGVDLTSGTEASADVFGSTATCTDNGESATATSGSVTITSIDASLVQGSFELTFASGHLTGNFSAPICPSSDQPTGTAPSCIP